MAAGINGVPLNAMGAVGVPISKYISNATHVGAAQKTGKETAQIQDTAPTPPPAQTEEAQFVPGLKVSSREDNTQCFQAQSGLVMNTTPEGKITTIEVPGEGLARRQEDGSLALESNNGAILTLKPFGNEQNDFQGYAYTRQDGIKVHINIADMSVGYVAGDQENSVWQIVGATGEHVVRTRTMVFDPKEGKNIPVLSQLIVSPEGEIEVDGYDKELRIANDRLQFKDPANFTQTVKFPQALPALATPPEQPAPTLKPSVAAPLLMEDTPPPPHPEPPVQIPQRPVVHAVVASQVGFDRDEAGQVGITFPSGVSFMYTTESGGAVFDPRFGAMQKMPAEVENFTSADGRLEKQFKFQDAAGVKYRCFQDSMDVLIDGKDGRVRQHLLPSGHILGQVQGPDGQFRRFELSPKGEVKADPGLTLPASSSGRTHAYWQGPDGKTVPIELPYVVPMEQQANAGMYNDMFGNPKYPQSGERLPAFAGGSPPTSGPVPPGPPPGTVPNAGPMAGFDPNAGPMAGTSFVPQQPPPQPGGYNPPPNMGPYPGSYTGYPGGSTWSPNAGYGAPPPPPGYGGPQQQAPYPGQGGPQPNYAGQQPSYPGQMPDMPTLMEKMKADFDRTNAMMWGQLAQSSATTQMMTMGQTMNSAMSGMQFGMAMWPNMMFYPRFW